MDFRQLEAFIETVNLNSFSKAAEVMFISQPSISIYINSLEKELGTKLIIRNNKDVSLTANGKIFYDYAKNILSLKENLFLTLKKRTENNFAELKILSSSVPAQYIMPDLIIGFNKIYPNIRFKIEQSDSKNVIEEINKNRSELGIVGTKVEDKKCKYKKIFSEKLVIISEINKKVNLEKISLKEFLLSENFIMRESGSATRMVYEKFLNENDVKIENLNVIASFSNTESVIYSVAKGLGVSIVSEVAANDYINSKKIKALNFNVKMPERDFYFVYKNKNFILPETNLFLNYGINYFSGIVKKI